MIIKLFYNTIAVMGSDGTHNQIQALALLLGYLAILDKTFYFAPLQLPKCKNAIDNER